MYCIVNDGKIREEIMAKPLSFAGRKFAALLLPLVVLCSMSGCIGNQQQRISMLESENNQLLTAYNRTAYDLQNCMNENSSLRAALVNCGQSTGNGTGGPRPLTTISGSSPGAGGRFMDMQGLNVSPPEVIAPGEERRIDYPDNSPRSLPPTDGTPDYSPSDDGPPAWDPNPLQPGDIDTTMSGASLIRIPSAALRDASMASTTDEGPVFDSVPTTDEAYANAGRPGTVQPYRSPSSTQQSDIATVSYNEPAQTQPVLTIESSRSDMFVEPLPETSTAGTTAAGNSSSAGGWHRRK